MDTQANLLYVLLLTCTTLGATAPTQSQQDYDIQVDAGSQTSKPGIPRKEVKCTKEHEEYASLVFCGDHLKYKIIACSEEAGNKELTVISYTCTQTNVRLGGGKIGDIVVARGSQTILNDYVREFIKRPRDVTRMSPTQKPANESRRGTPKTLS
jgi:hypothetical protein